MVQSLTPRELDKFAEIAYNQIGMRISQQKLELMNNRLGRRKRELGIDTFEGYYQFLLNNTRSEMQEFINVVTTNETYFFRASRHFFALSKKIFPMLKETNIDIWSAACSTGEEPYSLAIALAERLSDYKNKRVRIFASDINNSVLQKASEGVYDEYALRLVKPEHLKKYFNKVSTGEYQITSELRKRVMYGKQNLLKPFTQSKLDIIFCRNVLIYFDEESKKIVLENMYEALKPGGYLFLGESELIPEMRGFKRFEASIAQKES